MWTADAGGMRRQENPMVPSTTGGSSVPLFNQKKRNRVPLTSAPSTTEFFSQHEYRFGAGPDPHRPGIGPDPSRPEYLADTGPDPYRTSTGSASGPYGYYESPWPTPLQEYNSHRPAPSGSDPGAYVPLPYPYKGGSIRLKSGQSDPPLRHQDCSLSNPYGSTSGPGFCPRGPQSSSKPPAPSHQRAPAPRPLAPTTSWNLNTFGPHLTPSEAKTSPRPSQAVKRSQAQMKASTTLRVLTATIDGMRHWSQFKDKVPTLFEIFATLDSAVTVGSHGAKNFLLRDGKDPVQCVYYENEEELPRLIRGQVHRCVGNYDRSTNVLTCVSVRAGHPSELRNAHEAVGVCDAEMRAVVRAISEV